MIKRIAITGPESTGKSTLATQLAQHYQTIWVPEYARTYLSHLTRPYTLNDLVVIAQQQVALEKEALCKANQILICDTELLVMKVWSAHAFGQCPEWILQALDHQQYDLYLLTGIDIPWEPDPQREHPNLREYFYQLYRQELEKRGWPFVEIQGLLSVRLAQAVQAIDSLR
ncbi:MAG: ATP-binding protein [Bacteroidota bacterium]